MDPAADPSTPRGRRLRIFALIFAVASQVGCGPTPEQIGGAVLGVAPLVFAVAVFLVWVLHTLWRRELPDVPMIRWPLGGTLGSLAVLALVGLAAGQPDRQLVVLALWIFGGSYVTQALVVFRLWAGVQPKTAFTWAPVAAMAPNALLATLLVAFGGNELADALVPFWAYSGGYAIAPAVIWLALLVEAAARARRAQKMFRE